ncbi:MULTISPECIES: four helix bundle protein [Flavobacterium]|uniref:Four helix bundle protein n=1 Tax=Flavobacterium hankyongi TaxID=1176532 RepID=A0ABP9A6U9_9FLAO|nr:four helix bundle protein [Flavobacterium sp. N1846]
MSSELKLRTKQFSISIFEIVDLLPNKTSVKVVSYQLAKSGSSVGANYREACRARSNKEFIAKMNIVLEEADETLF